MRDFRQVIQLIDKLHKVIPGAPEQQIRILLSIALDPGVTQTELAEQLDMAQSSVSRNLRSLGVYLEKNRKSGQHVSRGADLIEMRPDLLQPKRLACYLTKKGEAIIKELEDMLKN